MKRPNIIALVTIVLVSLLSFSGCNSNEPAQPAQVPPAQAPAVTPPPTPATPPPAEATPPPAAPLLPVGSGDNSGGGLPSKPGGKSKGGGGIDKALSGDSTSGDELLGNYSCAIDSPKLKLGPFKTPPFGCKIFKAGDGSLKIGPTSDGAGSIKGTVKDQTTKGFFVVGKYEVAGNALTMKARMKLQGANKYVGKGRGRFNDDKSSQITYTLTMTKK